MRSAVSRGVVSGLTLTAVLLATGCRGDTPVEQPDGPDSAGRSTKLCAAPEGGSDAGNYDVALERADEKLGRLGAVRVYYPGPPEPWPGKAPQRDVVVSFKLPPEGVLAGVHDDLMRTWFADAPRDNDVYWVYYHEPEDDVEDGAFSAESFRAAFARLAELSRDAGNPRLRPTLVLQSFTLRSNSGRQWRDYYPGDQAVDVFAWDAYNRPRPAQPYTDPRQLLDAQREISESTGNAFAIAELGSILAEGDDGTGRAEWLRDVGTYAVGHTAEFLCWFDIDFTQKEADYRLRDPASLAAWRALQEAD